MTKGDNSKRIFFKKVVAAVGFISASSYLSNLMSARNNSIDKINENSAIDLNMQKKVWLQKQWLPMTDNEKKRMLDEILDIHNKSEA